jgi:hypothetical protein
MNHPYLASGKNQSRKDRDHKLQNIGRCILIVLAISAIILTGIGPAQAQSTTPTLYISPSTGSAGTVVTLSGSGYTPFSETDYCLSTSDSATAPCLAGTVGHFTGTLYGGNIPSGTTLTVPSTAPGGYFYNVRTYGSPYLFGAWFGVKQVYASAPFTCNGCSSPPPFGPTFQTKPATSVTATSVVLNGVVTPNGALTYWSFSYSNNRTNLDPNATYVTDVSLSGPCPPNWEGAGEIFPNASYGQGPTPVSCSVSGLQPSTTYYFNLIGRWVSTVLYFVNDVSQFTTLSTSLSLSSSSGPAGTVVTLSGSDYTPGLTYYYCLSPTSPPFTAYTCIGGTAGTFVASSPSGDIPTTPPVTLGAWVSPTAMTYYVVVAIQGAVVAYAPFTVTTEASPAPSTSLSLNPTSGPAGTVVTLSGQGYGAGEMGAGYAYCLSTGASGSAPCVSGTVGDFKADGSGNIPSGTTLTVPTGTAAGTYYVQVYGAVSQPMIPAPPRQVYATAPFTVTTQSTGSTQVCPNVIESIAVSSDQSSYVVGQEIYISWSPQLSSTASPPGEVTFTGPSGTYTFDLTQSEVSQGTFVGSTTDQGDVGTWTVTVTIFGSPQCPGPVGVGTTTFQVVATTTTTTTPATPVVSCGTEPLCLSPTSGPPGTVVTLYGGPWSTGTVYSYCLTGSSGGALPGGCLPDTTGTFTADSSGNIPAGTTLTIPSTEAGNYYVTVYFYPYGSSNPPVVAATASFTVTA